MEIAIYAAGITLGAFLAGSYLGTIVSSLFNN